MRHSVTDGLLLDHAQPVRGARCVGCPGNGMKRILDSAFLVWVAKYVSVIDSKAGCATRQVTANRVELPRCMRAGRLKAADLERFVMLSYFF